MEHALQKPRTRNKAVFITFCGVLFGTLGGCAIGTFGIGRFEAYRFEHGYALTTEVVGIHLRTEPGDTGLSLGGSRRTYLYPSRGSDTDFFMGMRAGSCVPPERIALHELPGQAQRGQAVVVASIDTGVRFDANTTRFGVMLGVGKTVRLHIDGDTDTVLILQYDSTRSRIEAYEFGAIQDNNPPTESSDE